AIVEHPTRASFKALYLRTRRLAGGHYDIQLGQATSSWQRQKVFVRALAWNLMPPVFFAISTFKNKHLQGAMQKLKVSLAMWLVRYISALELLRLKLGGASSRA
ncbi:MAG: glycosyltransferase family 2 protein, partial [Cyanobacteria bacterium P01_D01_bin.128]